MKLYFICRCCWYIFFFFVPIWVYFYTASLPASAKNKPSCLKVIVVKNNLWKFLYFFFSWKLWLKNTHRHLRLRLQVLICISVAVYSEQEIAFKYNPVNWAYWHFHTRCWPSVLEAVIPLLIFKSTICLRVMFFMMADVGYPVIFFFLLVKMREHLRMKVKVLGVMFVGVWRCASKDRSVCVCVPQSVSASPRLRWAQ